MRKITQNTINAFLNKGSFKGSNTRVFYDKFDLASRILLHDNCIATLEHDTNTLKVSNCGWFSNTTKERLNALEGVNIRQKNFKWFLNGNEWDGKTIIIPKVSNFEYDKQGNNTII